MVPIVFLLLAWRGPALTPRRLAEVFVVAALGSVLLGAVRQFPPPGGFRWDGWLLTYTLPFGLLCVAVSCLPLPRSQSSDSRAPAAWLLLPWLTTRLPLFLLSLYLAPRYPAQWPDHPWLAGFFRWDCSYYNLIALTGYELTPGEMSNMAFFPLYPLLLKLGVGLFSGLGEGQIAATATGLLLNNLMFPLGLLGLFRWVEACSGSVTARRAAWLFCVSPFSFFGNMPYSETLFVTLTAWSLYFVKTERPYPAFFLGGLAAVTRPPGTFFAAAIGIGWLWQQRHAPRKWSPVLLLGIPFLAFTIFQYAKFGHPFAFTVAQKGWGSAVNELWVEIDWYRRNEGGFNFITVHLHFLLLALAFFSVHLVCWSAGQSQALFLLGELGIVSLRTMNGMGRYVCGTVPLFLPWAMRLRGPGFAVVCLLSAGLQGCMFYGFYTGRWVN